MLFALLTAMFWSVSATCSARSAQYLTGATANRMRLLLASCLLLALGGLDGVLDPRAATWWFVLSGIVGLGLGDIMLFNAYERLGTRLPSIITHCLATPLAAAIEWYWLGNALRLVDMLCIAVILGGVVLALWPDGRCHPHAAEDLVSGDCSRLPEDAPPTVPARRSFHPHYVSGVLFGVGSAIGLAGAAVLSRRGYHADADFPWLQASLWRNLGGFAVTVAWWFGLRALWHATGGREKRRKNWRAAWPWLIGTSVLGPAVGVGCYQLALQHVQAGQVQAVVALVPVLVVPLAWWIDGDRPRPRSLIGGLIGVVGVIGMALAH